MCSAMSVARRSSAASLHVGVVEDTEDANSSQKLRHQVFITAANTTGSGGCAGREEWDGVVGSEKG